MAQSESDRRRLELVQEYTVWANLCENKHGLPWPILSDQLDSASDQTLLAEIKKLKVLGRTPHE